MRNIITKNKTKKMSHSQQLSLAEPHGQVTMFRYVGHQVDIRVNTPTKNAGVVWKCKLENQPVRFCVNIIADHTSEKDMRLWVSSDLGDEIWSDVTNRNVLSQHIVDIPPGFRNIYLGVVFVEAKEGDECFITKFHLSSPEKRTRIYDPVAQPRPQPVVPPTSPKPVVPEPNPQTLEVLDIFTDKDKRRRQLQKVRRIKEIMEKRKRKL